MSCNRCNGMTQYAPANAGRQPAAMQGGGAMTLPYGAEPRQWGWDGGGLSGEPEGRAGAVRPLDGSFEPYRMGDAAMMQPGYTNGLHSTPMGEVDGKNVLTDTMQQNFAKGIGRFVVCEMLIGTNNVLVREGMLTAVGPSYFVLYDEPTNTFTTCDFYALKFATFFPVGTRKSDVSEATVREVLAGCHPCNTVTENIMPVKFETVTE